MLSSLVTSIITEARAKTRATVGTRGRNTKGIVPVVSEASACPIKVNPTVTYPVYGGKEDGDGKSNEIRTALPIGPVDTDTDTDTDMSDTDSSRASTPARSVASSSPPSSTASAASGHNASTPHSSSPSSNPLSSTSISPSPDHFEDSRFCKSWIAQDDAQALLGTLVTRAGPKLAARKGGHSYPLATDYFGLRRKKDGAIPLDRWGSHFESWTRVGACPAELEPYCEKIRRENGLGPEMINSIAVNYYCAGSTSCIPAHYDSVTSLVPGSDIYLLTLGAAREFILCPATDAGARERSEMTVNGSWEPEHGDLFVLGPRTNSSYCHAVPYCSEGVGLRISIVFRSVANSFIRHDAEPKPVVYANGKERTFSSEVIGRKKSDEVAMAGACTHMTTGRASKGGQEAVAAPGLAPGSLPDVLGAQPREGEEAAQEVSLMEDAAGGAAEGAVDVEEERHHISDLIAKRELARREKQQREATLRATSEATDEGAATDGLVKTESSGLEAVHKAEKARLDALYLGVGKQALAVHGSNVELGDDVKEVLAKANPLRGAGGMRGSASMPPV
mmetsp:Transcript_96307/g.274396  ORF Transcript_96307/g.274396 Transcript_96307/m.274396 type:complete len:563 (-) Transcript_96307:416-2104(-)